MQQEFSAAKKLIDSANDEKSKQEAIRTTISVLTRLGLPAFIMILTPYTFMALYFAISNMVEKLSSLKDGGAFWFTDLTTPDALYIFPAMTSLFLLLRLEFVLHYSRTAKSHESDVLKTFYVLTFPLAASLPQAICSYFVAWSFASLTHMIVVNQPFVKELLYGAHTKSACPSSDGPEGPTAEDSLSPNEEHEQPLPPGGRKDSDSSVHSVGDQSDNKSEKDS